MESTNEVIKLTEPDISESVYTNGAYIRNGYMFSTDTMIRYVEDIIHDLKQKGIMPRNVEPSFLVQMIPINLQTLSPKFAQVMKKFNQLENVNYSNVSAIYSELMNSISSTGFSLNREVQDSVDYVTERAKYEANTILFSSYPISDTSQNEQKIHNNPKYRQILVANVRKQLEPRQISTKKKGLVVIYNKLYSGQGYVISDCEGLINILKGFTYDGREIKLRTPNFNTDGLSESEIRDRQELQEQAASTYEQERIQEIQDQLKRTELHFVYEEVKDLEDLISVYTCFFGQYEVKETKTEVSQGRYSILSETEPITVEKKKDKLSISLVPEILRLCNDFVARVVLKYVENKDTILIENPNIPSVVVNGTRNIFVTNLVHLLSNGTPQFSGKMLPYPTYLCLNILKYLFPEYYKEGLLINFFASSNEVTKEFYSKISADFPCTFNGDLNFYNKQIESPKSFLFRCNKYQTMDSMSRTYLHSVFTNFYSKANDLESIFGIRSKENCIPVMYHGQNLDFSVDQLSDLVTMVINPVSGLKNEVFRRITEGISELQNAKNKLISNISSDVDRIYGKRVSVRYYKLPEVSLISTDPEYLWFSNRLKYIKYEIKTFLTSKIPELESSYSYRQLEEDLHEMIQDFTNRAMDSTGLKSDFYERLDSLKLLELREKIEKYIKYSDHTKFKPIFDTFVARRKDIGLKLEYDVTNLEIAYKTGKTVTSTKLDSILNGKVINNEKKSFFKNYFETLFGTYFPGVVVDFETFYQPGYRESDEGRTEIYMIVNFLRVEDAYICLKFFTFRAASELENISRSKGIAYTYDDIPTEFILKAAKTEEQQRVISRGGQSTEAFYLISAGCREMYPMMSKMYEIKVESIVSNFVTYIGMNSERRVDTSKGSLFGDDFRHYITENKTDAGLASKEHAEKISKTWEIFSGTITKPSEIDKNIEYDIKITDNNILTNLIQSFKKQGNSTFLDRKKMFTEKKREEISARNRISGDVRKLTDRSSTGRSEDSNRGSSMSRSRKSETSRDSRVRGERGDRGGDREKRVTYRGFGVLDEDQPTTATSTESTTSTQRKRFYLSTEDKRYNSENNFKVVEKKRRNVYKRQYETKKKSSVNQKIEIRSKPGDVSILINRSNTSTPIKSPRSDKSNDSYFNLKKPPLVKTTVESTRRYRPRKEDEEEKEEKKMVQEKKEEKKIVEEESEEESDEDDDIDIDGY